MLRELESKDPKLFGVYGATSRVFSMTEVSFNIGMILGPLSGYLSEEVGYYYMNMTLGESIMSAYVFSPTNLNSCDMSRCCRDLLLPFRRQPACLRLSTVTKRYEDIALLLLVQMRQKWVLGHRYGLQI